MQRAGWGASSRFARPPHPSAPLLLQAAPGGDADGERSWQTLVSDVLVGVPAQVRGGRAASFLCGLRVLVCDKHMYYKLLSSRAEELLRRQE